MHRLTSYGPLLRLSVSDRRRPYGRRYLMLRWPDGLETAPRKAIAWGFLGFCPFSLRQRVPRFSNLRLRVWQSAGRYAGQSPRFSLAYISRMSGIYAILSRNHLVPVPILRMTRQAGR